jgi:hypothetical protein
LLRVRLSFFLTKFQNLPSKLTLSGKMSVLNSGAARHFDNFWRMSERQWFLDKADARMRFATIGELTTQWFCLRFSGLVSRGV